MHLFLRDPKEFSQKITALISIQKLMIVLGIQLEQPIIPPASLIPHIHSTKQSHSPQMPILFKPLLHLGHTFMMRLRFLPRNTLLIHQLDIIFLWQSQGHPKVRIRIKFSLLFLQFPLILETQCRQQRSRNRKTTKTRPYRSNIPQNLEHLGRRWMIHFLHLSRIPSWAIGYGNDTIFVQSLFDPFLFGGSFVSYEGTHDICMVGGYVLESSGWDKDLVSPKYGEASFAGWSVNS
mmetsp:Transcript_4868/g.7382  ORF Transcript_4868/g.7382 Transcript_4868/m.7382 type:complete len:235 (-) Transcript_4868:643-1347(-)